MNGKYLIIGALVAVLGFAVFSGRETITQNLGGNLTPQFSGASVVNTSSTVGHRAVTVITNASNSGKWFSVCNLEVPDVYCSLGTTAASTTGWHIGPASSSLATEIGTCWEMYSVGGAVSCVANANNVDATTTLSVSFVGQ